MGSLPLMVVNKQTVVLQKSGKNVFVDSHPCGWGSIPGKSCSFIIVSVSKSLSLYFMCSEQHVKYRMARGFPWTSSLLLDYHVKQYTHTHARTHAPTHARTHTHTQSYSSKLLKIVVF